MTGEVSPSDPLGGGAPELRASHADRDRVVDALRVAAGDGRLTAEELDQRLEVALTARTYRELAVLTADLPPVPGPGAATAKDLMRISHVGGSASRSGRWVVPKAMEINVTGGNVRLDFTDAVLTQPTLQIEVHVKGGNLVIVTKPGVVVDASEVSMIGGSIKDRSAQDPAEPVALAVEVTGDMRGGNVRIGPPRPPRRSFLAWLLRRPRPVSRALPPSHRTP